MKKTVEIQKLAMHHLQLSSIIPDPNQPRHFFGEKDMQELTESIRTNGVLQPILVRTTADENKFMVVCGERRYRASLAIAASEENRNTIPCTVRELTDAQALEIQIIENLQRKDIEPMEEAMAFKSLLDNNGFSYEDIAFRVAKSLKYVALRIKLNDLLPDFQEMLVLKCLNLADAYTLCKQSEIVQKNVLQYALNTANTKDWRTKEGFKCSHFGHIILKSETLLSSAKFDTSRGYEGSVSCIKCPFNTENNNLLFDEKEPTCTLKSCFENKTLIHINEVLETAQNNDNILLVADFYDKPKSDFHKEMLKIIEGKNVKFYTTKLYDEIEIEVDNPGTFEEWKENTFIGEGDNAAEMYEAELAEYKQALEKYNQELANPNSKKALLLLPYWKENLFDTIYVQLNEEAILEESTAINAPAEKSKSVSKKLSPEEQITELLSKEEFAKQKDNQIIFDNICDALENKLDKNGFSDLIPNSLIENALLFYLYSESAYRKTQHWFLQKLGLNPDDEPSDQLVFTLIEEGKANHFKKELIIRLCITEWQGNDYMVNADPQAYLLYNIAINSLMPEDIAAIETPQRLIAQERAGILEQTIEEIKVKHNIIS